MFNALTERLTSAFSFLRGKKELTSENVAEGLAAVRQALLDADVHVRVAKEFVDRVEKRVVGAQRIQGVDAGQQFIAAFHHELVQLLGQKDARLEFAKHGPTVVLVAGLQGAGKTTTCAKLAKHYRERHRRRPFLVAADVKRPAAVEQLKVLGRQIDVPVFFEAGLTPPELCKKGIAYAASAGADLVLLDTAGRLHVDHEMMAEVVAIARAVQPTGTVLVVDAMTGQDAVNSARSFHDVLELTGVVLTKLDGDARGGAAVSLREITGRPILFVGVGERLDDLEPFSPERAAGRILGMGDVVGLVERAQTAISEEEAQSSVERMILGDFTLQDMLAQLRMVRRLGPMKKVLGMMPGLSGLAGSVDIDDRQMNRVEALFTSMTPLERLRPDVLDMSRRRRIARGSGQDVAAVNDLLKRYKEMKQVMRRMGKLGLAAKMGAKDKRSALQALGGGGGDAGPGDRGGLGAGAAGLGGLFGAGGVGGSGGDRNPFAGGAAGAAGGAGAPGGGGFGGLFGRVRPMGSSATRKSGKKRKDKKKRRR